jgi:hypothetical protein
MTTTKPFVGAPGRWARNLRPATVHPALIESPDGERVPGVRVAPGGTPWFLLTEANAVKLAIDVLAAVDAGRETA